MTPLESQFLAILESHRGMSKAISVQAMAKALGFGDSKGGQRRAQFVKRSLVDQGVMIGSSCADPSGWYLVESEAEIHATLKQYSNRFYSLSVLIKKTRAALGLKENPQLGMF